MKRKPDLMMPLLSIKQLLQTCGNGKVLEIGCSSGQMVLTLVRRGVDAYGIDADPSTFFGAAQEYPDRFNTGTIQAVPFPDEIFDTVYSTNLSRVLTDDDVSTAFVEAYRVTLRYAYFVVAASDLRDRTWWEQKAFEAGFRRHPMFFEIMSYEDLESESGALMLLLEKIPSEVFHQYPLQSLQQGRELHMDMLRESGRRADAHTVRYSYFSKFVKDNDVVVDAACGLGYGSAILWDVTFASCIYGVDNNGFAIDYATRNYTPFRSGLSYRESDAADISFLVQESVDTVMSFETVEHVQDPTAFLTEVKRVLKPGGRFICSVPNLWIDETGRDIGPYHLHSFNYQSITELCSDLFTIERIFAQNAGGGFKFSEGERLIRELDPHLDNSAVEAEWWIIVCMKAQAGTENGCANSGKKDSGPMSGFSHWISRLIRKCQKL